LRVRRQVIGAELRRRLRDHAEGRLRHGGPTRVHTPEVLENARGGRRRRLYVHAVDLDLALVARVFVVGAHPAQRVEHLLAVHEGRKSVPRCAPTRQDVIVQVEAGRHTGLDREDAEPHLACQELEKPVLELEELARSMGGLPEADHLRVPDDRPQGLEVPEVVTRFDGLDRHRVFLDPGDDLRRSGTRPAEFEVEPF
jgi:hypothetical protein